MRKKITVIGTFHTEGGACTSDELLKVIQKISPDVIFFEAAPEDFPAMLKATETFNIPEIKAARAIIQNSSISIIPVDVYGDPFDGRLEAMLELFRNNSKEYFYASEIQAGETHRLGFPFLNSEDNDQILKDKAAMEKIFVARANHPELSKTHKDWLEYNARRENHWINLIYSYFENKENCNSIFLVGAAHRIRLMEKINHLNSQGESIVTWDFYPFKNQL